MHLAETQESGGGRWVINCCYFFRFRDLFKKSLHHVGAPAKTNTQKYRHANYACQILAHLYPRDTNLFLNKSLEFLKD